MARRATFCGSWVFVRILMGIAAGQLFPEAFQSIGRMEVAQVNLPVGLLIGVMIIPMLMKVDFGATHRLRISSTIAGR